MSGDPIRGVPANVGREGEACPPSRDAMRQLLQDLVAAYRDGMRLLQRAIVARATAGELDRVAGRMVDEAVASSHECEIDRAIAAQAAASRACEDETHSAAELSLHRL